MLTTRSAEVAVFVAVTFAPETALLGSLTVPVISPVPCAWMAPVIERHITSNVSAFRDTREGQFRTDIVYPVNLDLDKVNMGQAHRKVKLGILC